MSGYEAHTFWCIKCGNRGLDIQRKINHKHGKHHRKKLWCPWCEQEVNCIECRNDSEVYDFKMMFEDGEFKEELEKSLAHIEKENKIWS